MIAAALPLMVILSVAFGIAKYLGTPPTLTDSVDLVLIPAFFVGFDGYIALSVRRIYSLHALTSLIAGAVLGPLGVAFALWTIRITLFVLPYATVYRPASRSTC